MAIVVGTEVLLLGWLHERTKQIETAAVFSEPMLVDPQEMPR